MSTQLFRDRDPSTALPFAIANCNFAQDDRFLRIGKSKRKKNDMDFEINGDTYFVNLAENRGWAVFVSTPNGPLTIPVYDDMLDIDDVTVVVEDERKRRIPN